MKQRLWIMEPHIDQAAAFARLLQENAPNIEINGWSEHERPFFLNRRYFRDIRISPFSDMGGLAEHDWILPTGIASTVAVLESRRKLQIGEVTMLQKNLQVCDKRSLLNMAIDCKVPVPKTYWDLSEIDHFPVFVKDAREDNRTERIRFVADSAEQLKTVKQDRLLVQEFIDSPNTYGVGFIADRGRLVAHFTHMETVSIPAQGGAAVLIEKIADQRMLDYTIKLLAALDYSGWGLAEFKYCPQRQDYVLMEINAKWWASTEFALRNNPQFMKELFAIESTLQDIPAAVFLGRFLIMPVFRQFRHLSGLYGRFLIDRDLSAQLLVSRYLPEAVKSRLRQIFRNHRHH